jgi:thioredoxin reductase
MLDTAANELAAHAQAWLDDLGAVAAGASPDPASALFLDTCYWRDAVALTWTLETVAGAPDDVSAALFPHLAAMKASNFKLEAAPETVVRIGREVVEAFFTFDTKAGFSRGIVRLAPDENDGGKLKAWTFLTQLEDLKGFEEKTGQRRPTGQSNSRDFRGPNWLDKRHEAESYADHDPVVLIVGGGQAGLATAARLGALGVDCLIVDRHERIGDMWRKRYHALTLHNQVQVNHMPYMPFPPTWPTYIPKDKIANWFEAYVEALELNYWTGTEFLGGTYDEAAGHWTVRLKRADGSIREMKPRHVVLAPGVSGVANRPDIATLENFEGRVVHSSEYTDGEDFTGKKAIVIGTGNSGHDISQDLYSSGATVTMVQRSPTLVTNIEPAAQLPYTLYDSGPPLEDCDLITVSMPTPLVREAHVGYTDRSKELDAETLAGLRRIGFKLAHGADGTGWQFLYLTRGGGYYFNVGCSDLLIEEKIRLIQFDDIDHFEAGGARLKSGETIPADLVVLATGYKDTSYLVARLFGDDIAEKVGPIWGFGDGLELRNMYRPTPQPGLWFIAGSLAQCRINSKYLAQQIKAMEEGLIGRDGTPL